MTTEAKTLKLKKQIKKGKLKKTFKNVLCRPDPAFWPQTSDDENKTLTEALNTLKVTIPDFQKLPWSELCHIPKKIRPKPPPIPKVEGLIFGIAECQKSIEAKECIGVLIETAVNPKSIVQPLIDTCFDKCIPVLCLKELRSHTRIYFGIATSVLGVVQNYLPELESKILEISKCHKPPNKQSAVITDEEICVTTISNKNMDTTKDSICPYLYRTNKQTRVFTPLAEDSSSIPNKFVGQNFIQLPNNIQNEKVDRKQYMKMIVKKISSNPNRRKITKVKAKN